MKLLAVCESPPTTDPRHGNGSTLIAAHVLPRLPDTVELTLAYFHDRPGGPDRAVLNRCLVTHDLPIRPTWLAHVAQTATRLPRATWQRTTPENRTTVERLAADADVVYLHGFHTFGFASAFTKPLVVNEIDPWSLFWAERSHTGSPWRRWYDSMQSRRARRLERWIAGRCHDYIVVNHADAEALEHQTGRPVTAIPNGVETLPPTSGDTSRDPHCLAFVGTLDYAPNIEAARTLCREVLPNVREQVPEARLVLAGRRPGSDVAELAGDHVDVRGDVASVHDVFAAAGVAVYPGTTGRGTKNTILEALGAGCPVVASAESVRGVGPGHPVVTAVAPSELGSEVVSLLRDDGRRRELGAAGAAFVAALPNWDDVAARYGAVFDSAVDPGV